MELILYFSHRSYTLVKNSDLRIFLDNNQEQFSNFDSLGSVILESRLILKL